MQLSLISEAASMPQSVIVSREQWNAIVQRIVDLEDTVATLQAELELATGEDHVETIVDPDAFLNEIMGDGTTASTCV